MVIERLKFYADTDKEKNKFFCWKINSIMDLDARLKYFMSKMYIRSAWYEFIDTETGETSNQSIDLDVYAQTKEILFVSSN